MKKVLVSACLLGNDCRYDGGNCHNKNVIAYLRDKEAIVICPEQLGGFTTPRPPAEINGRSILTAKGEDVTIGFMDGAQKALAIAKAAGCEIAVLKEESPSCGKQRIFDGSFQGIVIAGSGITASLLSANGIEVLSEEEIEQLV